MDMHEPTATEIAWCAGLFEGEGNIGSRHKTGPRHSAERLEPRLQIPITDLDVLEEFQRIMGGRIKGPYTQKNQPGTKTYWRWTITSWDEFRRIGGLMRPYFGKRRGARFDYCMEQLPETFRRPNAYRPCDYTPVPSVSGYLKHRRRGERACPVCLESNRLYYAEYLPKWRAARAQKANLQT